MNLILPCAPGCCENDCPPIASDSFNREDNFEDINDGAPFEWGNTNADIWIVDGTVAFVSGVPESIICPTPHPDGASSGIVSAVFTGSTDGDQFEVFLSATDVNNCLVGRLTAGTGGRVEVISRVAAVDHVIWAVAVDTVATDPNKLTLMYDATLGRAKAYVGDSQPSGTCGTECLLTGGTLAGCGTGQTPGGYTTVDDWSYTKLGGACPDITCIECILFSDSFTRTNSTNLGAPWVEVSGSWEISSNKLACTSAGIAIVGMVCLPEAITFKATFNIASITGNHVDLIFAWQDASNYYFVRYDETTISIRRMVSGSPHTLKTRSKSHVSNNNYASKVCVTPEGHITVTVPGQANLTAFSLMPPSGSVGLAASSATTFDDVSAEQSKIDEDSSCETCPATPPTICGGSCKFDDADNVQFVVDFGDGGLTDDECGKCDLIVGEFSLAGGPCAFTHTFVDGTCIGASWLMTLGLFSYDGQCFMRFKVMISGESTGGSGTDPEWAEYESELGIEQNDGEWVLTKSPGHAGSYRGITGWENPGENWGTYGRCSGSLPETVTIRMEYA